MKGYILFNVEEVKKGGKDIYVSKIEISKRNIKSDVIKTSISYSEELKDALIVATRLEANALMIVLDERAIETQKI